MIVSSSVLDELSGTQTLSTTCFHIPKISSPSSEDFLCLSQKNNAGNHCFKLVIKGAKALSLQAPKVFLGLQILNISALPFLSLVVLTALALSDASHGEFTEGCNTSHRTLRKKVNAYRFLSVF